MRYTLFFICFAFITFCHAEDIPNRVYKENYYDDVTELYFPLANEHDPKLKAARNLNFFFHLEQQTQQRVENGRGIVEATTICYRDRFEQHGKDDDRFARWTVGTILAEPKKK